MTASTTRSAPLCRLLQVVIALQSDRRPNAGQLAEEVGVSRRTIFRDLETIERAGLRVEYDAARQGYRIAPGPPSARGILEEREVLALTVLANRGGDRDPFGLAGAARSGLLKLVAGLPEGARRRAEALDLATRVESSSLRDEARRAVYDRLLDSVVRGVHVRLRVRGPGLESEETLVAPYRLVEGRDGWSVLGRSSLHRGVRLIPLARVESAEPIDEPAPVPPRFRSDRWLGQSGPGETATDQPEVDRGSSASGGRGRA